MIGASSVDWSPIVTPVYYTYACVLPAFLVNTHGCLGSFLETFSVLQCVPLYADVGIYIFDGDGKAPKNLNYILSFQEMLKVWILKHLLVCVERYFLHSAFMKYIKDYQNSFKQRSHELCEHRNRNWILNRNILVYSNDVLSLNIVQLVWLLKQFNLNRIKLQLAVPNFFLKQMHILGNVNKYKVMDSGVYHWGFILSYLHIYEENVPT